MTIEQWLSDPKRTYADGVELYKQFKRNNRLDNLISAVSDSKPGQLHFIHLENELRNIYRINRNNEKTVPVQQAPPAIVVKPVISINKSEKPLFYNPKRYDINLLSPEMREKFEQNQTLTKEISSYHEKMKVLGKSPENNIARQKLRGEMLAKEALRNDNWKAIDTYWNSDERKNPKPKIEDSVKTNNADNKQLFKDIEAAKRYIGRYRNSKKTDQIAEVKLRQKFLNDNGINWKPKEK